MLKGSGVLMARQRSSTKDDFDRVKDAVHKLRSENRKLRKENASLRKQLNRVADVELERQINAEDPEDLITVPSKIPEKKKCPKCNSADLNEVRAGKYLIVICGCGYRRRSELKKKTQDDDQQPTI
jgi:regulator of replication initiation timing